MIKCIQYLGNLALAAWWISALISAGSRITPLNEAEVGFGIIASSLLILVFAWIWNSIFRKVGH